MQALWLLVSATAPLAAAPFAQSDAAPVLIEVERLVVRPGEELSNVAVLVERGVVVAVGQGLVAPEGARHIQAPVLVPGFVDSWSSLGLEPESAADLGTAPSTPTAGGIDSYAQEEERLEALRGGVTCARVQAGLRALHGGVGAVIRCAPQERAGGAPLVVLEDACLSASIGLTRGGNLGDVFDRVTEIDKLVGSIEGGLRYREAEVEYRHELEAWEKAIAERTAELEKDFKKAKKDREKEQKEAEEKGKEFKEEKYKEDKKPRRPKVDPDQAAFARVAMGELPLVVEVHRSEEIRRLLEKTEPFGRLRLVLAGATEARDHADELVARRIPVIVWPSPGEAAGTGLDEYTEHDLALAGDLAEAGVEVLIGTGGGASARDLRLLAALAVGHGLDRESALAALTSNPARVFDLRSLGSVERGKDADLVVLDGDPLDSTTRVQYVLSRGVVVIEP